MRETTAKRGHERLTFEARLLEMADLARRQREGPYTAQADAMTALHLIEELALLLIGAQSVDPPRRRAGKAGKR